MCEVITSKMPEGISRNAASNAHVQRQAGEDNTRELDASAYDEARAREAISVAALWQKLGVVRNGAWTYVHVDPRVTF